MALVILLLIVAIETLMSKAVLYQEMGAEYALPAGYSEHNSGLSLDVGSSLTKMNEPLKESG